MNGLPGLILALVILGYVGLILTRFHAPRPDQDARDRRALLNELERKDRRR